LGIAILASAILTIPSLLTLFLIKTHEPDKAEAVSAKAVKSGRAIAPEYLDQLKKLKSGR
jgi:hypothetical protein